jgi:aquaporin related protein
MLKWLQYETVLGPEDGPPPPAALGTGSDVAPGRILDEEKAIGGDAGGLMAISGPGLGDLHTEAAPTQGVSHLCYTITSQADVA